MKRDRGCCAVLILSLLAAGVCGCGERAETESEENPYAAVSGMEETPVVDYAVERQSPNILTDAVGYAVGYQKTAAVTGSGLPEEFRLVDAETGETVYVGWIEETVYGEQEIGWGTADFDSFDTPGTYYVECDRLGESYRFEIREELYPELFGEVCGKVEESIRKRELSTEEAIVLLEAYEWYGALFPDGDGDTVPDILSQMKGWVAYAEENGVEPEEQILYAAVLAKFGYLYQKYDREYATDCLKRASTVFGQAKTPAEEDADTFLALTELYRAAGLYAHRRQIESYKAFFEENDGYLDEKSYLYGAMTYMATRQKVDVEMCESLMGNLMNRSEELSRRYEEMIRPVAAENGGPEELLKYAEELSCANYIMNNYQYTGIVTDFLHYLMGQNQESVCYYAEAENTTGYLLLFAHMASDRGGSGE
ncbi:MAG: glycoside hydrolase family 9 protein [bacterium]|nr:glycoside hydrolase family 9 protein [bacterium]